MWKYKKNMTGVKVIKTQLKLQFKWRVAVTRCESHTMPHGVMVSTQEFDSCNIGSIPVGVVSELC